MGDSRWRDRARLRPPRAAVAWTAIWVAVAALVVLPYMHFYRHLSPFDEMVHVDYVVKVQHGQMVNGGEKVGQVAMRAQACRGSDLTGFKYPRCPQKVLRASAFPSSGYNTAYPDPPVYYVVTAVGAAVVGLVPGVHDFVTEARSIGVLWLGAGLALTFLLALRLGANRIAAAGATLVLAAAPTVAHASATVTSDAPALLVGALLCLTALGVVEGRVRWWWLLPAALLAGAVKATSLVVIGLVAVYLLLQLQAHRSAASAASLGSAGSRRSTRGFGARWVLSSAWTASADDGAAPAAVTRTPVADRGTLWRGFAAVVGGGLFSLLSWTVVTSVTARPGVDDIPMRQAFHVDTLSWTTNVAPNIFQLATPLQIGYLPTQISVIDLAVLMAVVNLAILVSVATVAWAGPRVGESAALAAATAIAMLAGGTGFVLLLYVGSHTAIPIPPRYGLTIVPAGIAVLAVMGSRRRAGGWVLVGLGVVSLAALVLRMF